MRTPDTDRPWRQPATAARRQRRGELRAVDAQRVDDLQARSAHGLAEGAEEVGLRGVELGGQRDLDFDPLLRRPVKADMHTGGVMEERLELWNRGEGRGAHRG